MLRILLIFIALQMLTACSSTPTEQPSIRYYLLEREPSSIDGRLRGDLKRIQLASIGLPDYLSQSNLVMRERDHGLRIANYHHWAGELGEAIQRALIVDLNQDVGAMVFDRYSKTGNQIKVDIEHFYPTADGQVILSGRYALLLDNQPEFYTPFHFAEVLAEDGYENSVKQMRALLQNLSVHIKTQLTAQSGTSD